jgi:hypothetical protein
MTRRNLHATSLCCHLAEQLECIGTADLTFCVAVRQYGLGVDSVEPASEREVDSWPVVVSLCHAETPTD